MSTPTPPFGRLAHDAGLHAPPSFACSIVHRLVSAAMALFVLTSLSIARTTQPEEVSSLEKVKPGKTALLKSTGSGMHYFLRVPKTYGPRSGARLIVFLHGSNMNGLSYLQSFEAKKWCENDILLCPNGENGTDPFGANNFGFNSAPLVAGVTRDVQKAFPTEIAYVGGHSQGAFLTYNLILTHPDLFRGAFPMAGDCWIQNEPSLWEDKPEILKKQKEIAIAVIHGQADPVVKFSQGEHAYDCFRAMGWTKLRLFAPKGLNHMFMLAPIDEAIAWLDAMNGRNEKQVPALAAKWGREGEWGWVLNALNAAKSPSIALQGSAEAAAQKAVPGITAAMKSQPSEWIPKWAEFWRIHGLSKAAQPLITQYLAQRAQERASAVRLFNESQSLFRSNRREEALKALQKLQADAPHTYHAYFATKWLADKK